MPYRPPPTALASGAVHNRHYKRTKARLQVRSRAFVLLDNMCSWALLNAGNEVDACNFLRCLELTRNCLPGEKYDFAAALAWFNQFIGVCAVYYRLSYLRYQEKSLGRMDGSLAAESTVRYLKKASSKSASLPYPYSPYAPIPSMRR